MTRRCYHCKAIIQEDEILLDMSMETCPKCNGYGQLYHIEEKGWQCNMMDIKSYACSKCRREVLVDDISMYKYCHHCGEPIM